MNRGQRLPRKRRVQVTYFTDGNGRWWRREWPPQCSKRCLFVPECQGVAGHTGVHWCFARDGSFKWRHNDAEPLLDDAVAGTTPPGHPHYRSRTPHRMASRYYRAQYSDTEVDDEALIARLERDDAPPERDAAVIRPYTGPPLPPSASGIERANRRARRR